MLLRRISNLRSGSCNGRRKGFVRSRVSFLPSELPRELQLEGSWIRRRRRREFCEPISGLGASRDLKQAGGASCDSSKSAPDDEFKEAKASGDSLLSCDCVGEQERAKSFPSWVGIKWGQLKGEKVSPVCWLELGIIGEGGGLERGMQISCILCLWSGARRQACRGEGAKKGALGDHYKQSMLLTSQRQRKIPNVSLNEICRRGLHSFTGNHSSGMEIILGRRVREALANGEPVVALESTLITHGLPEPDNLSLALSLEEIVAGNFSNFSHHHNNDDSLLHPHQEELLKRKEFINDFRGIDSGEKWAEMRRRERVTPATVGIIKGQLVVGLSRDEIEFLASRERSKPIKVSRRDIAIATGLSLSGGTTVSATMAIVASLSRSDGRRDRGGPIKVFATGGTGGVHLGGELSLDISADLYEFARSPIGVVSSGFKSFLDTRRSLEFLETMGCPVVSLELEAHSARWLVDNNGHQTSRIESIESESAPSRTSDDGLFPGFLTRTNWQGVRSPRVLGSLEEAAKVLYHCLEASALESKRAMLLANPIARQFSLDRLEWFEGAGRWGSEGETSSRNHPANGNNLELKEPPAKHTGNDDKRNVYNKNRPDGHDKGDKNLLPSAITLEEAIRRISYEIDKQLDLKGAQKTPLILERLNHMTGGKSLSSNLELLKGNARVGAELALEYAKLASKSGVLVGSRAPEVSRSESSTGGCTAERPSQRTRVGPVVVGCTMIDMHVSTKVDQHFKNNPPHSGVSFEGEPHLTLGGVGRNLACAIELLGHEPNFITSLGNDNLANFALEEFAKIGLGEESKRLILSRPEEVGSCFALVLVDSITGLSEFVVVNLKATKSITSRTIDDNMDLIARSPLVVMDANLDGPTIVHLIERCHERRVPIFLEPTDKLALRGLVESLKYIRRDKNASSSSPLESLLCLSPNLIELKALVEFFGGDCQFEQADCMAQPDVNCDGKEVAESPSLVIVEKLASQLMDKHLPELRCLLVTLDKGGVLVAVRHNEQLETIYGKGAEINKIKLIEDFKKTSPATAACGSHLYMKHFPVPTTLERPISSSGAGDSFAAGFISGLLSNATLEECLAKGFEASLLTLQDKNNISMKLRTIAVE